jgi:hypothetical protein
MSEPEGRRLVEQMLSIVAYAEVRAVLLAWAGTRSWNPALRARSAVASVLAEEGATALPVRAMERLRHESQALLAPALRRQAPWPFDQAIGAGQIGTTDGLEQIFHAAGKVAAAYRGNDVRCLSLAVSLAELVRRFAGAAGTS